MSGTEDRKDKEAAQTTEDVEIAHSSQGAAEGDAKDQSPPPEGISSDLPATG